MNINNDLIQDIKNKNVILFAGAGVSMNLGLPSWSKLIDQMAIELGYETEEFKKKGSFLKAMKFILKKMEPKKTRSAFFVCSLTYKAPHQKPVTVIGKIYGSISKKILGKKGFGYDPIFIPKKKININNL